jgi:hypothetical protein
MGKVTASPKLSDREQIYEGLKTAAQRLYAFPDDIGYMAQPYYESPNAHAEGYRRFRQESTAYFHDKPNLEALFHFFSTLFLTERVAESMVEVLSVVLTRNKDIKGRLFLTIRIVFGHKTPA